MPFFVLYLNIMKIFSAGKSKTMALAILILANINISHAQNTSSVKRQDSKLIQVSGLITTNVDSKSLPVPYAIVKIKNSFRGTIAGVDGFYSVVAKEHDTLDYYAIGFKRKFYIVPSNPTGTDTIKYITLSADTITFDSTNIYPWPTKEQFRYAFLNLKLDDDYTQNAVKNLDQRKLSKLYEQLARDGQENQLYSLQKLANSYYYAGGQTNYLMIGGNTPIPSSLLNPFAWAQFFQAIKDGKFKNTDDSGN